MTEAMAVFEEGSRRHPVARISRRVWALLTATLVVLTMFAGNPATAAQAVPAELGLSISNGGVTEVSSYADTVSFEARISLPSGVSLDAGAETAVVLDRSLKRVNNGALPSGATAQNWNESTNTLTVTWGPLLAGNVYAVSINASPSGVATQESLFQATATLQGASGGNPLEQTVVSTPIAGSGDITASMIAPAKDSWTVDSPLVLVVQPGNSSYDNVGIRQRVAGSAFTEMLLEIPWGVQVDNDEMLPSDWLQSGQALIGAAFPTYSLIQNDATARIQSYGSVGGAGKAGTFNATAVVPANAAPGRYSVPVRVYDMVDGVKTLVHETSLTVIVPEPSETSVIFTAKRGANQVYPGGTFDWGNTLVFDNPPPGPVQDLTVTIPIPEHTVPTAVYANYGTTEANTLAKRYEYTTAAVVNDASEWKTLPRTDTAITLGNLESITGIRYVMNNFSGNPDNSFWGGMIRLRAADDVPVGTVLQLKTGSISYLDPIAGATVAERTADWDKTVTVVQDQGAPPAVAVQDTPVGESSISFDQVYPNTGSFSSRFFTGSSGVTPLKQPYMFVVVPKGMDQTKINNRESCFPRAWPYTHRGCDFGNHDAPLNANTTSGKVPLADGSTLYYAKVNKGELLIGGRVNMEQLHMSMLFNFAKVHAGEHKVLVGTGSMVQNDLSVSTSRTSHAAYSLKSLSDDASFGDFAGLGDEIRDVLSGMDIVTDQAFIGERSFFVSPTTTVGSATTIQGSEDASGIAQGTGTATARPGGAVHYDVEVSNTGSLNYSNFQFIDQLPSQADTYTLNGAASRGSAYDVTLSGNVQVLVNGVPSAAAILEYTNSATPAKFDAAGQDVAGDAWLPYTGAAAGAKAIRVTLAPGTAFGPGDKVTLSFDATVPASAPRDGSTAKNTIAYRFQTGTDWVAAETPSVEVKSSAPAGDTELSGQAFLDVNGDGVQQAGEPGLNASGVSLQLYKIVSGNPVAVGSAVTPNTDAGLDGAFAFIGIDPNLTYRVKPVITNPNVTVAPAALDGDGFLKYVQVTDAGANGGENTAAMVGLSSFQVGDQVGLLKWVKDLRVPLIAQTSVEGAVQLADVNAAPIVQGTATAAFVQGYTVKLMQGATVKAETVTDSSGAFAFTNMTGMLPGDHTLEFVSPSGSRLVGSELNSSAVFSGAKTPAEAGEYKLTNLQPGTGATDINVFYTDEDAPVANTPIIYGGVTVDAALFNPQSAQLYGTDLSTRVMKYSWQILDVDSVPVASGDVNLFQEGGMMQGIPPFIGIPETLADGAYTFSYTAIDLVGNVSDPAISVFNVDTTAPELASVETTVSYVKTSPAAPTTSQGWIDLFGVTAADAGAGMPASGGITVDASDVDPETAGSYTVSFTATDAVGNVSEAYEVTYVVAFVADPTITLGSNSVFFEMGETAPADDAEWQSLFGGVTTGTSGGATAEGVAVDVSAVDAATLGSYPVVFTVTDSLGYSAQVTGTFVVRDTIAPVITTSTDAITYVDGDTQVSADADWIAAYGAAATDSGSGLASLTVDAGSVNYAAAGVYAITFTATDNVGNTSTKTVNYTVAFAGAPTITLGNDPAVYEMGTQRPDLLHPWTDLFQAEVTTADGTTLKSLTIDYQAVDFMTLSATGYDVVFIATDSFDNKFSYTGKLIVQDSQAPSAAVAKPTGKLAQQLPATPLTTNDWLEMFEVTAVDNQGGSGIDPDGWIVTEGVNFGVAGEYTIEFIARDLAGNESTKVTATLTIQAPPTSDTVTLDVPQDKSVGIDPLGRSVTTGSFEELAAGDLGTPSAGGSVALKDGGVVYTPAEGFFGEESLTVTVTDDLGQTGEITYTFNVLKKAELDAEAMLEYFAPVDGSVRIPVVDVLGAFDTTGLELEEFVVPEGFVGEVKLEGDYLVFTADGSNWHGTQNFSVALHDRVGQTVVVPVHVHVVPPSITIDQDRGYAGKTEVTLTANGLVPGKKYTLWLNSDPILLGTITADTNGSAVLVRTIPAEAVAGAHTVSLMNADAQYRASVAFEVLAEDGSSVVGSDGAGNGFLGWLSVTGGNGVTWLTLGVLLLLGGALMLVLRRRKTARQL